jgi:predicted nucleic acid-binding protein
MSLLLDTNVLSELLRASPDPAVLDWFSRQPPETLLVSAITQAEMMLGARLLPEGKRRSALENAVASMFAEDFAGRILPFDSNAVAAYVEIFTGRRAIGRPIAHFDAQIAAIARCQGCRLATRNLDDFEGCGVPVVNPWTAAT